MTCSLAKYWILRLPTQNINCQNLLKSVLIFLGQEQTKIYARPHGHISYYDKRYI